MAALLCTAVGCVACWRNPRPNADQPAASGTALLSFAAQLHALQELVEKAEAWLERAADATRSRAPLKKLRDLLHAGVRLGADVPQV